MYDNITNIENLIDASLGIGTSDKYQFAKSPMEEAAAFQLLIQLRRQKIGWMAVKAKLKKRIEGKLEASNAAFEMQEAERRLRPWIID